MAEPDAVIDVLGLEEYKPVVGFEEARKISKSLADVVKIISNLEIAATVGNDDVDLDEIAGLSNDLNWHISDIETAIEILDDYEEFPDILHARDNELASRLDDDEKEELEEQVILYRLKNKE